jgi:hypothetical protein
MSQSNPDIYTGPAPGATTVPAVEDALKACVSMHSGAAEPSYKILGTLWYDTTADVIKLYNGTSWNILARVDEANGNAACIPENVTTGDDATPSVKGIASLELTSVGAGTITNFDNGAEGQILTIRTTNFNDTIAGALTATGMAIPLFTGDTLQWIYDGAEWKQIGGSVGMGQFVPVKPPNQIGDWPAATVIAPADVDVSDDGVRKGAVAAQIVWYGQASGAPLVHLYARENGVAGITTAGALQVANVGVFAHFVIPLDNTAKFEAYFSADWDAVDVVNLAYVHGYWI